MSNSDLGLPTYGSYTAYITSISGKYTNTSKTASTITYTNGGAIITYSDNSQKNINISNYYTNFNQMGSGFSPGSVSVIQDDKGNLYLLTQDQVNASAGASTYSNGNIGVRFYITYYEGGPQYLVDLTFLPGISSSGPVGTPTTDPVTPCYLAGTNILTNRGYINVENIMPGDISIDNAGNSHEIIWVGNKSIINDVETVVVIKKNAIAQNVPDKDLYITGDHRIYWNGRLYLSRLLVNGASILYDKGNSDTVYHLETKEHSVIMANGLSTESYLDTGNRSSFHAGSGGGLLDCPTPVCNDASSDEVFKFYNYIISRTVGLSLSNFVCKNSKPNINSVKLLDEYGTEQKLVRKTQNYLVFHVKKNPKVLTVRSETCCPHKDIARYIDDRRELGVLVGPATIFTETDSVEIKDHLTNSNISGWNNIEDGKYRWSNGFGRIKVPDLECQGFIFALQFTDANYV